MATQAFITHITQASACCVQVSPNEYLETALQPVKGPGRSVEAKNAVSHSSRISLCQKQERQEKWSCKGLPPSTRRFTVFQSPHIDPKITRTVPISWCKHPCSNNLDCFIKDDRSSLVKCSSCLHARHWCAWNRQT